jgi:hypothetical protein
VLFFHFRIMHKKISLSTDKLLAIFAISALLLTICSCKARRQTVSTEGMAQCRAEAALTIGISQSQEERQSAFRTCLDTIDGRLQANRRAIQDETSSVASDPSRKSNAARLASSSEITTFCSSRKDTIEAKVQAYNEVTGKIGKIMYLESDSNPELRDLEQERQRVLAALEAMIPMAYRLNKPLMPDATSLLMRCDQKEILSTLGQ